MLNIFEKKVTSSKDINQHEQSPDLYKKIMHAAKTGDLDLLQEICENNTDINIHIFNEQPLRFAASGGHLEVVRYLTEIHQSDIQAQNNYALRWASANKHLNIARYLIKHGAEFEWLKDEFNDIYAIFKQWQNQSNTHKKHLKTLHSASQLKIPALKRKPRP